MFKTRKDNFQKKIDVEKLIKLNLELENKIDENGDLIPFEGNKDCLLYISKHKNGFAFYFNHNIPSSIREELKKINPEKILKGDEIAKGIFNEFIPCKKINTFVSCYFIDTPSTSEFLDVIQVKNAFVIRKDNKNVSSAWAQEENEQAIELAVETLPDYQKRGYGKQVVAACTYDAMTKGKIAFYSYEIDNVTSAALAKSLGVIQYAQSTAYSSN